MPTSLFEGQLFADYFQIYLRDTAFPELPDDYSDEAIARRLTPGDHGVILHTSRNMMVPVLVVWHETEPSADPDQFQHVVEASFEANSGELIIAGMTDAEATAARLSVPTGMIGLRANLSGLDTISEDGLEGEDQYLVQLWPARQAIGLKVLKMWEEV